MLWWLPRKIGALALSTLFVSLRKRHSPDFCDMSIFRMGTKRTPYQQRLVGDKLDRRSAVWLYGE